MPRTRRDVQDTDGEESGRELWTRVLRVPPAGGLARSRGGLRIFSVGVRSKVIGERGVRGTRANPRRRNVVSDVWYISLEWKYSVAFESRRERASRPFDAAPRVQRISRFAHKTFAAAFARAFFLITAAVSDATSPITFSRAVLILTCSS